MTSAIFWACIAVICLMGWTVVLIFVSKSILPMANALSVLGKLNFHIDEQIRKVVERILQRQNPKVEPVKSKPAESGTIDALRNAFGGSTPSDIGAIFEQPDSEEDQGMEVVDS